MAEKPLRILVSGDVDGNVGTLYKRIENIQKDSGKFDLLLCVGDFFGQRTDDWSRYAIGQAKAPISTLILGPNKPELVKYFSGGDGTELCENITYLGKRGHFTGHSGLHIAYLSGLESPDYDKGDDILFGKDDVAALTSSAMSSNNYKGIDILITSQWPKGVEKYGPEIYLYAFSIVPLSKMDSSELAKQPADATECPYKTSSIISQPTSKKEESSQFFYDMNAREDQKGGHKRKSQGGDHEGRKQPRKPPEPQGPCWFCLGSPQVEKHLIISVGTHNYVALAKGGLVPDNVLILPIGHYASTTSLPSDIREEIEQYKTALRKCFRSQGKEAVFYERNFRSVHLQIQVIAIPKEVAMDVKDMFFECAESACIELAEIPKHSDITQIMSMGQPYFFAELPGGEKLLHRISKGFPLLFGREVLAQPNLLNVPERIDWKECKATVDEEKNLATTFKKLFKPYDFTLNL